MNEPQSEKKTIDEDPGNSEPKTNRLKKLFGFLLISGLVLAYGFSQGYFAEDGSVSLGINYAWKTLLAIAVLGLLLILLVRILKPAKLSDTMMLPIVMPLGMASVNAALAIAFETPGPIWPKALSGFGNGLLIGCSMAFAYHKGWIKPPARSVRPTEST